MSIQLAHKSSEKTRSYSEADMLLYLKHEAAKVIRLLESGAITSEEAARRLNALADSNRGFVSRVFRL
jgi:hypothetical protein